MNAKEAVTHVKARLYRILKTWNDTPISDAEVVLPFINEAMIDICEKLRPLIMCISNNVAIDPPTSEDDVLRQSVWSIDVTSSSDGVAPNWVFLGVLKAMFETRTLDPVPMGSIIAPTATLLEQAQANSTPVKYAVVPRGPHHFNVHLIPAPNGIEAGKLQVWYYYAPGALTELNQEIELPLTHVSAIWPYVIYSLTGDTKAYQEYRQKLKELRKHTQPEAPLAYRPPSF